MNTNPHPFPAVGSVRGRAKGVTFREFTRWAELQYGSDRMVSVWARLPAHLRKLVDPGAEAFGIVPSTWYPSALPNALLDGLLAGMTEAEQAHMIREGTRYALSKTFRGVYRFLFHTLLSPARLAQHIQKVWDLHYDSGTDVWTVTGPGRIETRISGWIGHNRFTCEISRESSVVMLELLGCANVVNQRTHCVDRGDPFCAGIITYQ